MIYCICGFPRSGSTMLYNMFRYSVSNLKFYDKEMSALNVLSSKEDVCTKRPKDIFKAQELSEKADVQFIITIRDPRDILVNVEWKDIYKYYKQLEKVPDPVIVRYESLVSDANAEQIFLETQFPEIEFFRNFHDFYLVKPPLELRHYSEFLEPVNAKKIRIWKNNLNRIKNQIEKHHEIADVLVELGYEKDNNWISIL